MLALFGIVAAFQPEPALSQSTQAATGSRIDSILTAAEARGFHGNILVGQPGGVILSKGYGVANRGPKPRYTPSTLVQIGSNVKDFTKLAIYQLVEAGRLQLNDSLGKFVSGLSPDKRAITVTQLLQHTGGLPLGVANDDFPLTREEMLKRLRDTPLKSSPGATRSYSNLGYALLGLIIESVTRQSYDAYVAAHILSPLGLTQTGTYLPKFDQDLIAHGFNGDTDIGSILDQPHDKDGHLWALRANGGYLSTLDDMYRFYQAVIGPNLLKDPEHRRMVFDSTPGNVYAGSDLTSFFLVATFPQSTLVIIASNHSAFPANRVLRDIEDVLSGGQGNRVLTTTSPAGSSVALPDTGAAGTIKAYLTAFNSGNEEQMRTFFSERAENSPNAPSIKDRLDRYRTMRGNLGKLTLKSWGPAPDGEGWAIRLTTEQGDPATFTMMIEPQAPYRFQGLKVEVGD